MKLSAISAVISKAPPLVSPMKEMPRFSPKRCILVRSRSPVKLGLIACTGVPSNTRYVSLPSSNPTMDTRTAAPSSIQGRSLHAIKILPVCLICSNTRRFAPARIACVASKPARFTCPRTIKMRARSNQYVTRSASRGTRPSYRAKIVFTYVSPNSVRSRLPPRNGGLPMITSASGRPARPAAPARQRPGSRPCA
jgi:hypothetical protein